MIYLLTDSITPRLAYTAELLFSRVLQTAYELIEQLPATIPADGILVNYTHTPVPHAFHIPNQGLLHESRIRDSFAPVTAGSPPLLFTGEAAASPGLGFDLLSAVFYLATEYEKYIDFYPDAHQRYDERRYPSGKLGLFDGPLLHEYGELLWKRLKAQKPALRRKEGKFEAHFTFDLDHPWKYLYKGKQALWGGLAKDILQLRWPAARDRIRSMRSGQDPNDVYELIKAHFPPACTTFFIQLARHAPQDTRYTFRHPRLRALVKELSEHGYAIGIHPSYTAYLDKNRLEAEIEVLANITGVPVDRSRQHFLRYRLPDTFRYLHSAGIHEEYSLCMYHHSGFRTGLAIPYPWFDLLENQVTSLLLHPTMVMDTSLRHYLGLSPGEAIALIYRRIEQTRHVGGRFTLLLHNESLSEAWPWQGWRQPLLQLVDQLVTEEAHAAPGIPGY